MDNRWTIGNIIDLEYTLKQDMTCSDEKKLKKRDRQIFINHVQPRLMQQQEQEHLDMSALLRTDASLRGKLMAVWLERMKAGSRDQAAQTDTTGPLYGFFPGALYEEVLSLMRSLFLLAGALVGFSLCMSFFSYTGQQPLNISYFLALTLFPQLALLVLFSGFYLLFKFRLIANPSFVPYPFLYTAVEKLFMFLNRSMLKKISPNQLHAIDTVLSIIRQGRQVYGLAFFWPMFMVMQLFGIAFNLAVLLSVLFRVLFFDTAFGWQSTLQVGADAVEKVVTLAALPWSWLHPSGFAVPELEQIVGTRMILKDGIHRLATEDLVSWWPFLCMAVVVYGLLPRILLFFTGGFALKKCLAQLTFDHGSCSRVIRRLLTPHVETEGAEGRVAEGISVKSSGVEGIAVESSATKSIAAKNSVNKVEGTGHVTETGLKVEGHFEAHGSPEAKMDSQVVDHVEAMEDITPPKQGKRNKIINDETGAALESRKYGSLPLLSPFIALVPEDLHDFMDKDHFINLMESLHGCRIVEIIETGMDFGVTLKHVEKAGRSYVASGGAHGGDEKPGIVFMQEAWQPPIKETLSFIKGVRECMGKKNPLMVALIGKPRPETIFTPVGETDWEIWKMKLATVSDPWLSMEKMVME